MAKISLSKLNLTKVEDSFTEVEFAQQVIIVKQYLPVAQKMELISRVINNSVDGNGYYNPARVTINLLVEIMLAYTNIGPTEKQREDVTKLYDLFISSGLFQTVMAAIPAQERQQIQSWTKEMIHSIYEYKNSVYGILDVISSDYSNLDLDADVIAEKLGNKENLELLREVLTKLD